jgi:3-methylfumaryl-CoA hydratase
MMTSEPTDLANEWRGWIGRQNLSEAALHVEAANCMAALLDRAPTFQPGDELPALWHWLYFHDIVRAAELGPDGHPRLGVNLPPVPLPRRMWAGGSFEFHSPLRLGERAQKRSTIRAIEPKEGRTGRLYFITIEHIYSVQNAVRLAEEQTIVYRELSGQAAGPAEPAPATADYSQEWRLENVALFRYSALTFNGHRIHYDVDYCRNVEGYPNLVIHGPLIATLLIDLCTRHENRPIKRFVYRAKSPLFLPDSFTVNGSTSQRPARLWARSQDGALAMDGEVEFVD